jgi:hypothetical protein
MLPSGSQHQAWSADGEVRAESTSAFDGRGQSGDAVNFGFGGASSSFEAGTELSAENIGLGGDNDEYWNNLIDGQSLDRLVRVH